MLTFESSQIQGTAAIVAKLTELPFKKVAHRISTLDAQPSSQDSGGVLVMVTGELLVRAMLGFGFGFGLCEV